MTSELYLNKALLQIKKKDFHGAEESLQKGIELSATERDGLISNVRCAFILGEMKFMEGNYKAARSYFESIENKSEEIYASCDDLLNDEINFAAHLIEMMDTFSK